MHFIIYFLETIRISYEFLRCLLKVYLFQDVDFHVYMVYILVRAIYWFLKIYLDLIASNIMCRSINRLDYHKKVTPPPRNPASKPSS